MFSRAERPSASAEMAGPLMPNTTASKMSGMSPRVSILSNTLDSAPLLRFPQKKECRCGRCWRCSCSWCCRCRCLQRHIDSCHSWNFVLVKAFVALAIYLALGMLAFYPFVESWGCPGREGDRCDQSPLRRYCIQDMGDKAVRLFLHHFWAHWNPVRY